MRDPCRRWTRVIAATFHARLCALFMRSSSYATLQRIVRNKATASFKTRPSHHQLSYWPRLRFKLLLCTSGFAGEVYRHLPAEILGHVYSFYFLLSALRRTCFSRYQYSRNLFLRTHNRSTFIILVCLSLFFFLHEQMGIEGSEES